VTSAAMQRSSVRFRGAPSDQALISPRSGAALAAASFLLARWLAPAETDADADAEALVIVSCRPRQ